MFFCFFITDVDEFGAAWPGPNEAPHAASEASLGFLLRLLLLAEHLHRVCTAVRADSDQLLLFTEIDRGPGCSFVGSLLVLLLLGRECALNRGISVDQRIRLISRFLCARFLMILCNFSSS